MVRADHDLLIEIRTKLEGLSKTVEDFNTRNATKADMKELSDLKIDHEGRIRAMESWVWKAIGGIGVLQIILTVLTMYSLLRH